ncbi:solute carrier family 25 member 48 [Phyllostomus discolor]|uniref:Solute carrier family 25 member 48 n=1 Tax=Phyllostomus discolor TaxID=89673 RepID=A0A833YPP8_9CHIR|nr:solute carrier family 25 member 48 [Phyllostomus discolor]
MQTRLQAGVGYGNTLTCIRTVYRKESVFGFFKGMSFPLASIAVYNSVVFGVFSNTQRFLSQHQSREPEAGPPHTLSSLLLASVAAGMVSVGLGTPVDLIKIRLQMQTQPFRESKRPGGAWCPGACDPLLIRQIWGVVVNILLIERGLCRVPEESLLYLE